jgi:hypothetical protein
VSTSAEKTHHFGLDKRLEGIYFAIIFPLHQTDLSKGTFANDFDGLKIIRPFFGSQKAEILSLSSLDLEFFRSPSRFGNSEVFENFVKLNLTADCQL